MKDLTIFFLSAFFEILGCFAFWNYFKLQKSIFWLVPGLFSLIIFAYLLTKIDLDTAGRVYAIYGGIYIASSLAWLYFVEEVVPDYWDLIGAAISIIGALIILYVPR